MPIQQPSFITPSDWSVISAHVQLEPADLKSPDAVVKKLTEASIGLDPSKGGHLGISGALKEVITHLARQGTASKLVGSNGIHHPLAMAHRWEASGAVSKPSAPGVPDELTAELFYSTASWANPHDHRIEYRQLGATSLSEMKKNLEQMGFVSKGPTELIWGQDGETPIRLSLDRGGVQATFRGVGSDWQRMTKLEAQVRQAIGGEADAASRANMMIDVANWRKDQERHQSELATDLTGANRDYHATKDFAELVNPFPGLAALDANAGGPQTSGQRQVRLEGVYEKLNNMPPFEPYFEHRKGNFPLQTGMPIAVAIETELQTPRGKESRFDVVTGRVVSVNAKTRAKRPVFKVKIGDETFSIPKVREFGEFVLEVPGNRSLLLESLRVDHRRLK